MAWILTNVHGQETANVQDGHTLAGGDFSNLVDSNEDDADDGRKLR